MRTCAKAHVWRHKKFINVGAQICGWCFKKQTLLLHNGYLNSKCQNLSKPPSIIVTQASRRYLQTFTNLSSI